MASTPEATDLVFPIPTASYACFKKPRVITTCNYTDAQLNATLQPSPRARLALVMLRAACTEALGLGITEARQKYIKFCEAKIQEQMWITRVLSSEDHAMMEDLVRAWQEEEYRRPLSHTWKTLANEVATHKAIFMDDKRKDSSDLKAYRAFRDACAGAALYEEDMLDYIMTYAFRSSTHLKRSPFPNEIKDALAQCHWYTIANIPHKVIRDLGSIIPSTCEPEDRVLLKRYFYTLRDKWFSQVTFEDPRTWTPKRGLVEEACGIREARGVPGREVDVAFNMLIQDMDMPRCHPETKMKVRKGWTEEYLAFAMAVDKDWVATSRRGEELRGGFAWSVLEAQGK